MLNQDALYDALLARDASLDGRAYVAVRTTRIFCRLTCPARKPKRENCTFYNDVSGCLEAGYRPCKRCQPLRPAGALATRMQSLIDALEAEPAKRWSESTLVELGHDPSTVRRQFREHFGVTFLEMARLRRLRLGATRLRDGDAVIDAQLDAGFSSDSGFRDALARLLNVAPASLTANTAVRATWIDTPIGAMIAAGSEDALHVVEFYDCKDLPRELRALGKKHGPISLGENRITASLRDEMSAYFEGHGRTFSTPVNGIGTDFTKTVWRALCDIPYGSTVSYGELAQRIGNRKASRAVARANGSNPMAIIVPCHRVIAADGSLSGYAGGPWRKRWLLDHERRVAGSG
ncbi:MAG: trifunctional transcriptional activator/DNA repair protein Ada/methylated-DNA--[protein]-cysteine S-methyltransferase [Pseudomonadota bacterium]